MSSRLLLLTPRFYGIEREIFIRLENLGFNVIYLENKILTFDYHGKKSSLRLIRRLYYFFFRPDVRYIKKFFKDIEDSRFDLLFAINCHSVCPYLFYKLRYYNSSIRSVVFLWDSLSVYSWEKEVKLFDKSLTYNSIDAEKLGIIYKPNFFIKPKDVSGELYSHDVFFAGKFNLDRFNVINELDKIFINHEIDSYIKLLAGTKKMLHNRIFYKIANIVPPNKKILDYIVNYQAVEKMLVRDYIVYDTIEYMEAQAHLAGSNVVLDIAYYKQSGYSHRIIEALSRGKKIITTNRFIKYENFYDEKQIKILDADKIEVDIDWLRENLVCEIPLFVSELELTPWLKSVLEDEISKTAA
jgi:hypothetical protein